MTSPMTPLIPTFEDEPISRFLLIRLRLSLPVVFVLMVIAYFGFTLLLSCMSPGGGVGPNGITFLRDWSTLMDFAVLNPLVVVLVLSFLKSYNETLQTLADAHLITLEGTRVESAIATVRRIYRTKIPLLFAVVVTALTMSMHISNTCRYQHYFAVSDGRLSLAGAYMMGVTAVYVYFLIFTLLKIAHLVYLTRVVFSCPAKVNFLHEDGCGGMKVMGNLCMKLNIVLFLIAITVCLFMVNDVAVFKNPYSIRVVVALPIYLVMSPLLFFFPLIPIHKAMAASRETYLRDIRSQINDMFRRLHEDMKHGARDKGKAEIENLHRLLEIYRWVEKMPSWPIDTGTYVKFAVTFAGPLCAFVLQLVIGSDGVLNHMDRITSLFK